MDYTIHYFISLNGTRTSFAKKVSEIVILSLFSNTRRESILEIGMHEIFLLPKLCYTMILFINPKQNDICFLDLYIVFSEYTCRGHMKYYIVWLGRSSEKDKHYKGSIFKAHT